MKLAFLVVFCVLGTAWCETHDQQDDYAETLVVHMEDVAQQLKEMLDNTDVNTEDGKKLMLLHANVFNINVHFILDCLQHVITKNQRQSNGLQTIVSGLNRITFELEKSFNLGVSDVKLQFRRSIQNVVMQAKNLQNLIRENGDLYYTATVLRFLDDLVSETEKPLLRGAINGKHKFFVKSYITISSRVLSFFLYTIKSENENVYKDIVRYSSKFSSTISKTGNLINDWIDTYNTTKIDEVKEIVYSLSKMVKENEEVLYNEKDFKKIKNQFKATILKMSEQLNKMVDCGYSADGKRVEDDNLVYVVLPEMVSQAMKLARNLQRTVDDNINNDFIES